MPDNSGELVVTALGNGLIFNVLLTTTTYLPFLLGHRHRSLTQDDPPTNTNAYARLFGRSQCSMETVLHT